MRKQLGNKGFTLAELLFVLAIITIAVTAVGFIGGFFAGNFWFGETSALKAVQFEDPSMKDVIKLERGYWGYGKVIVQGKNEVGDIVEKEYYIDTNILQKKKAILNTDD